MARNVYKKRKNVLSDAGTVNASSGAVLRQLQDAVESYLQTLKRRKLAVATIAKERFEISRFTRYLAGVQVQRFQDVSVQVIEHYRSSLLDDGVSHNTAQGYLCTLKRLFTYLEGTGTVFENPLRHMDLQRRSGKLPQVISTADVRKLLNAPSLSRRAGIRDRAMLEVLYSTGMRCGELTGLKLADVDLHGLTVRVFGKNRTERVLPLGRHAAEYTGRYLNQVRPGWIERHDKVDQQTLFITRNAGPLTSGQVLGIVRQHAKNAGLPPGVSPQTLRRSCATHMLVNGAHPLAVSKLLGHAELKTLSHYLRVSITDMRQMHRHSRPGR